MSDPVTRLNAALEGRYRIERQLGEGGMATVYLAADLRHERKVALKVLRPELAAVVGAERFLAEIKTTAGLQHPHILPLFDSGEAEGFLFYVMPFVKGESLQERLEREHQLPVDEAVAITTNLAEALDYAHREGVIHRDIKPANVLMLEGKPVIADFGIALAVGAAGGGRLTETGLSVGTPHYMSPEQATGDQAVGPPADIYALGAVLYELLAGEPPYSGGTAQAILGKIITSTPEPVTAQRPSVRANVDAVIRMALEKVPADRFRTAAEMAKALRDPGFRHGQVEQVAGGVAHNKGWRTATIAASVVALASLAALVTQSTGAGELASRSPVRTTLVSSNPSDVYVVLGSIAISRDGSEVAFTGSVGGQRALFVRSLDDPEVRRITAPGEVGDAGAIAFSPDGRSVAFTDSDTRLRRVSVDGTQSVALATLERGPIGLSWSATYGPVLGMLSFSRDYNSRMLQRLDPAETALSTVLEGEGMHHGPWVLPDDESALYVDIGPGPSGERVDRLARVSFASGEREVFDLPDASVDGGTPVVGVSNGVLLIFNDASELVAMEWDEAGQRPRGSPVVVPGVPEGLVDAAMAGNGTLAMILGPSAYEVAIVDDRGNLSADVSEGPVRGGIPRFSPSGDRVAVVSNIRDVLPELWIYDVRSDVISQLSLGFPAFRGFELGTVAWSPDGRTLMGTLGNVRDPLGDLRARPADGSEVSRSVFSAPGTEVFGIDLAPDGVTLAMTVVEREDPNLPSDLALRRLDTDSTFTRLTTAPTNERAPRFSPDGRWLAYASDESGVYEVYAQRFPGPGGRVQVSDAGGGQPVWSADGRRIFYQTEGAILAAEVTVDASGERLSVGRRTQLFQGEFYGGAQHSATYDVHPEGDRFVVTRAAGARANEIVVWIDWLDELKQLLAERNR